MMAGVTSAFIVTRSMKGCFLCLFTKERMVRVRVLFARVVAKRRPTLRPSSVK